MRDRAGPLIIVIIAGSVLGAAGFLISRTEFGSDVPDEAIVTTVATATTERQVPPTSTTTVPPPSTTTTELTRQPGSIPGWTVGEPWGSVPGLTMFRGSPSRSYYGSGPLPPEPKEVWTYPESPMCSTSRVGGETKVWCGMGWTGQPVVYERSDGVTELIFGAYDRAVHFLDADSGQTIRPSFETGDLIKGSVTLDPDGFPLLYFGSRDNKLRVLALDRDTPEEIWSLNANEVRGIWNNDWDGNPMVIDDVLYEGGENGWFFAYQLNRGWDSDGFVTVSPVQLLAIPGYDDDLIAKSGRNVSIESSAVAFEERVYFTNSGGRVVGLDVSSVSQGSAPVVFDFYAGGDIDATPVVDAEGFVYLSIEHEPSQMDSIERERNRAVGQLVKIDPYSADTPVVWGIDLTMGSDDAGIWATPAIFEGVLYVNVHNGDLIAVDTQTGEVVWSEEVGWHSWSSPSVVDSTLVVATCTGELRGYSLSDPRVPLRTWTVQVGPACLEATPAIWNGSIYIGSRDGFIRAFR